MPFKASTDGECVKCHGPIHKGEPITWKRTGPLAGRYHFTCPGEAPAAVSIITAIETKPEPVIVAPEPTTEPTGDDFTSEPEPELAPIIEPGSRAWLRDATVADRERYMLSRVADAQAPITRRDWAKLTARMSARLDDKQARKLSRWARGVWDGLTVHSWGDDDAGDYRQMGLDFAEPVSQEHGEVVMGWRSLVAAWNEGV
jgi:hypothetical protein